MAHTYDALMLDASLDLIEHSPKIYALYIQALDYGQKMTASNPTQPQHKHACIQLKSGLKRLQALKKEEALQRQRRQKKHQLSQKKRWLPMLCMGAGTLVLSFGLTGAMFALPMEELMLFNTFMVGEEILVALLSGGTGIVGLCTMRKPQNHHTTKNTHASETPDKKIRQKTEHAQQQAMIDAIHQCLNDLKLTAHPAHQLDA